MKKKIFITGASGFVGSHLVEHVYDQGFEVHAAVRASSNTASIQPFVHKFVSLDFTNVDALKTHFDQEQYNYIIHAAALTKAKDPALMQEVNVGYTHNILTAAFAADMPLERVCFVGSLAAIGPVPYAEVSPIMEDSPYHPLTVYGRSKQAAEEMIKKNFADKPISVIRPTAVYGPREKDLFILFDTLNKGLDPYIGKKPQKLSFVYVKDLVEVILQACLLSQEGLQFYNISDGNSYSKYALADVFKHTFAKNPLRLHIPLVLVSLIAKVAQLLYKNTTKTPVIYPERLGELTAENWNCSIQKAKNKLNYIPKYDLSKGLTETLNWYKANNWL